MRRRMFQGIVGIQIKSYGGNRVGWINEAMDKMRRLFWLILSLVFINMDNFSY